MNVDEPRFLARTHGYVRSPFVAMDHLEAVDADEQRRQTEQVRLAEKQKLAAEWRKTRETIRGALDSFRVSGVADRSVLSGVRAVSRSVDALDRRVSRSA